MKRSRPAAPRSSGAGLVLVTRVAPSRLAPRCCEAVWRVTAEEALPATSGSIANFFHSTFTQLAGGFEGSC
jgi:hypothetical protein